MPRDLYSPTRQHRLSPMSLLRAQRCKKPFPQTWRRSYIPDARPFAANDIVLLRQKDDRSASPILTMLKPEKLQQTHKGIIPHNEIIGKRVRDVVKAQLKQRDDGKVREAAEFRVHEVKLDEYVRLSRRLVTPIYPADANLIVSLLDLHPSPWDTPSDEGCASDERLEILEAGTGHGALTLYLSRAIHAANAPQLIEKPEVAAVANPDGIDVERSIPSCDSDDASGGSNHQTALSNWKTNRRAIIHTIDISPKYRKHAESIVRGFRHGLYYDNIDFHVGDVSNWIQQQRSVREKDTQPFLGHAFLDLPSAKTHLETVANVLRTDGTLILFNPSITQINECVLQIKKTKLPLELECVVELGVNGGSGGREWDVRAVKPRALSKKAPTPPNSDGESADKDVVESGRENEPAHVVEDCWSMVCRPRVGERVVGGGFLGVWKKMRDARGVDGR